MPRGLRIEYPGAFYHVMARGNRRERIYLDDDDRRMFLKTLGEAYAMTGWRVHAWVLMSNHHHLVIETPEANLIAGMEWMQNAYTRRFNVRHRDWGRLFGERLHMRSQVNASQQIRRHRIEFRGCQRSYSAGSNSQQSSPDPLTPISANKVMSNLLPYQIVERLVEILRNDAFLKKERDTMLDSVALEAWAVIFPEDLTTQRTPPEARKQRWAKVFSELAENPYQEQIMRILQVPATGERYHWLDKDE